MSTQPNPHIGSSFDAFLAEEGMLEACEEQAIKELVAEQIARAMQEQGLTRTAMAARMRTSRAALNRLLDPRMPRSPCRRCKKRRRLSVSGYVWNLWTPPSKVAMILCSVQCKRTMTSICDEGQTMPYPTPRKSLYPTDT